MDFSSSTLDKIRDVVRISDVISKRVKLQKKGKDFFGLCPFHNEKSPSFSVNDEKNFYHCFGCGAHGDAIKFVQETQNVNFVDSVKFLASEYNIKITQSLAKSVNKFKEVKILEINKVVSSWLHKNLFSKENTHIVQYLEGRGIQMNSINDFCIGYAPLNGTLLIKYLLSLGYHNEEIIETGIAIYKNATQICKFRNRIIFPIKNRKGDVIAFGGRVVSKNDMPKYLNSPETLVFKKRNALYLEDIVFKNVKNTDTIFVVEGYIDAMAMHAVGLTNAVATLGTAVSDLHLKKLWTGVCMPTICMDGDKAGLAAVDKIIKVVLPLLKPGYSLKFIKLPTGYDPDTLIQTHGAVYFKDMIAHTINLCEIIWDIYLNKINVEIPENKALLKKTLLETSDTILDLEIRNFYKKYFLRKLNALYSKNYSVKHKKITHMGVGQLSARKRVENLSILQRYEFAIAAILISNPYLLQNNIIFEKFVSIVPHIKALDRTYIAILNCFTTIKIENGDFPIKKFQEEMKRCITDTFFDYLCGHSSYFIDTISKKTINEASELWFNTFERYNLELMKGEYKLLLQKFDNESLKIADKLKKEIGKLEQKLKIHAMNKYG